jgi:bacterioferritin (cytochrome b1)
MEISQFLGFLLFLAIMTMGFWLMMFLLMMVVPYWLFGNILENWKLKRAAKKEKS